MRKILIFLLISFICTGIAFDMNFHKSETVYCSDDTTFHQLETELNENIDLQLSGLDFSKLQEYIETIPQHELDMFGSTSFLDRVKNLISGEFSKNQQSIWNSIINLIFDNILNIIPIIFLVIAISVIFSLVSASRPQSKNKSIGDIIHFVCYGAIIIILITSVSSMITLTSNTIQNIKTQIDVVMPILLTMMTAIGGTMSVGVYQPAVAILSGAIIAIFTKILMPIFIFRLVFSIVSNL